ncbi:MAG: winged helix-turn-helix domain-containing protein [Archaeoglobaceae archaeon]
MFEVLAPEKRRAILSKLKEGKKDLKTLSSEVEASPPVVLKHLKKLEEAKLVEREGRQYSLTYLGDLVLVAVEDFERFLKFVERDYDYWLEHDLTNLPREFKLRLPEIGNYEIIRSDGEEVLRHFKVFSKVYTESKIVRALSAVMFPDHPKMFVDIAKKADVEVVVTSKIVKSLREYYQKELQEFLDAGGKIYVNDDVRMTVIVTEKALCLGFFLRDGVYDTESGVISYDESAKKWGFEVFEYFKARSQPL